MNISEITKKSIQTIAKNGDPITPILFFDTFCGEARRNKVAVEDCDIIKNFIDKLDTDLQIEVRKYHIRTIKEFLSYLVSALNRLNGNHLAVRYTSLLELTKKMTEAIAMIDNKELEDLSGRTNGLLNRTHSPDNLDDIKREWARFSTTYRKDRNREKLSKYIPIDKNDDLDSIIDKILPVLEDGTKQKESISHNQRVVDLVFYSMNPSLVSNENKEIENLYRKVRTTPTLIYNREVQDEIEKFYHKRIDLDRSEEVALLSRTGNIIGSLVDIETPKEQETSFNKIETIDEVEHDLSEITKEISLQTENEAVKDTGFFSKFASKLDNVKNRASSLFARVKRYSDKIAEAKNQFENIKDEVSKKRAEADLDILTKTKSKKSFEKDMNDLEAKYISKNENYSLIVVDIDRFFEITKKYGNDAGDLIIKYFSKILKEYIAKGDSVARYGDDNFVILLPNKSLNEAMIFTNKFKEKIKHTKFVYKDERVYISFSAGIADRFGSENTTATMDIAKARVKEAKDGGRDRIIPDPTAQLNLTTDNQNVIKDSTIVV